MVGRTKKSTAGFEPAVSPVLPLQVRSAAGCAVQSTPAAGAEPHDEGGIKQGPPQANVRISGPIDEQDSYASNEVAINWNAPLVFLLAAFI